MIKSPKQVEQEQEPEVATTFINVNKSLVSGRRKFFQSMLGGSDIPPGHMTAVIRSLEKAGWIVDINGARNSTEMYIEVFSPFEIQAKS